MITKLQGIVLSFVKYRESSIICKILTNDLGIQSYIVNGVRKQSKSNTIAFFQPLSILDLVVYNNPKKTIHRISEIKSNYPFQSIYLSPNKIAIGIFISEIISKGIKEGEANEEVYLFVKHSLIELDAMKENYENFHLAFLIHFIEYLGFRISSAQELYLVKENFNKENPLIIQIIDLLIQNTYNPISTATNQSARRHILELLLNYYYHHFENMGKLNSIKVLQEINS